MREHVDPGTCQRLGVFQIEDVRGGPEAVLVRLLDEGVLCRHRHLRGGPEVVVHADLDDVRLRCRNLVDFRASLLWPSR